MYVCVSLREDMYLCCDVRYGVAQLPDVGNLLSIFSAVEWHRHCINDAVIDGGHGGEESAFPVQKPQKRSSRLAGLKVQVKN